MGKLLYCTLLFAKLLAAQDATMRQGDVFGDPRLREKLLRAWIEESRAPKVVPKVSEFDLQFNRAAEAANKFVEKAQRGLFDRQLLEKFFKEVHKLESIKP